MQRLCGKLISGNLNARDLLQIKKSLGILPNIIDDVKKLGFNYELDPNAEVYNLLEQAVFENPPVTVREGSLIKSGYNKELDELRSIRSGGKEFIASFEETLKEETGIKNLKVGYNKIFGYYIEVSKGQSKMVMEDFGWERRQTLTN